MAGLTLAMRRWFHGAVKPEASLTPSAIAAPPGVAVAGVAWRARGRLNLTVIAKATFAFVDGAKMIPVEPQGIIHADIHHHNNPGRSVRLTSDLAPYLARVDVFFTGHAHAPPGLPAGPFSVRLALFAGERPILDKALSIEPGGADRAIPLAYERAFGGIGMADNPFGTRSPTVLDPARRDRPAGFAPLGSVWPSRTRLLGRTSRKALEAPILEIPDDFDWSYFQAAPPDQRVEALCGDEWLALQGLHPTLPVLRTRLPGARALARVQGLSAFGVREGQPLELVLDTLHVDGDRQACSLLWRRSFPLAGEAALAAVRVVVGVELPGAPPASLAPAEMAMVAPRAGATPEQAGATVELPGEDGEAREPRGPARRLEAPAAQESRAPAASAAPLPFRPGAAPSLAAAPSPQAPRPPQRRSVADTHSLSSGEQEHAVAESLLPFRRTGLSPAPPAAAPTNAAAAPAPPAAAAAPSPAAGALVPPPAAAPAAPAAPAAAPAPRSPWGGAASDRAIEPAPPRKAPKPQKLDIQQVIYGSSKGRR
ncbi:DUF2169 domain-containing protein [Sorangium sp. So ce296]|uniref:DUF2169 family type VI secretion system accessory protein n=1 Tax=Sorangium sp. So ce296 TaxID=3133296 RepID=UPI003F5F986D